MADHYVGLMSGTSMDGIDAVVVRFSKSEVDIVATHSQSYPDDLKTELLAAIREPLTVALDPCGALHRQVGGCFRDAAMTVIDKSGVSPRHIKAIGSHGQTLRHQPNADNPFSLQIGDANLIAHATGIATVANFRQADIAAGGQGAPLVPLFHDWLFRSHASDRAIINIGGISNVTVLPADQQDVTGFDTGPGNGLMDAWIRLHRNRAYDDDGAWAASGTTSASLLELMLEDGYFALLPPKSTGFEYFNIDWLSGFDVDGLDPADVQATLCELSAATIAASLSTHAAQTEAVFVCGGGSHNLELMRRLQRNLPATELANTRSVGLHPDWVEAVAFAWLAMRSVNGKTGNLPSVTGASHRVVLGDIHSI